MREPSLGYLRARLRRGALALTVMSAAAAAHLASSGFLWAHETPSPVASAGDGLGPEPSDNRTSPITGWLIFCHRFQDECTIDPSEPAMIEMTPAVWQAATTVNRRVNRSIKAITDQEHWGVGDRWDYPADGYGDCEDFQLLKRKLLVRQGLPRRALRMTVVIDDEGLGHAVLMMRTTAGDFILDNKRDAILPPKETGYTYIKREGDTGMAWIFLGAPSPVATANQ